VTGQTPVGPAGLSGVVDACRESDIPQVADLHCRTFYDTDAPASDKLKEYYRDIFFRGPWTDPELPSLVYRTAGGEVIGFMGRISRPMLFHGRRIRAATAHRLMVKPDSGHPMAAVRLVRKFLAGPQDLTISDGANDKGRQFCESAGATTVPFYSMEWIWPVRPSRYLLRVLARGRFGQLADAALWPVCAMTDLLASRRWRSGMGARPKDGSGRPFDASTLAACVSEASQGLALRPLYDQASAEWLWARLRENTDRGRLRGKVMLDRGGQPLGGFLYYARKNNFGEVVFLGARPGSVDVILRALFHTAAADRLAAVGGRVEVRFLTALLEYNCIFKRGSWGLVHARDPEIMQTVSRGDAVMSALEGELWLRSPMDRL